MQMIIFLYFIEKSKVLQYLCINYKFNISFKPFIML